MNPGTGVAAAIAPEVLILLDQAGGRLCSDTRRVSPGCIFFALPKAGFLADPKEIQDRGLTALQAGAVAVVASVKPSESQPMPQPWITVADVRRTYALCAALCFGEPSREMLCLGVTGTSGKTTTTFILESILQACGHRVGMIGTVLCRYPGVQTTATHTTPGAAELQGLLAQMRAAGCTAVVMEVSSHAIEQRRVDGVCFDGVAFTGLSPEHLDYHQSMEEYFEAKARLFDELTLDSRQFSKKTVAAVVHVQTPWGKKLAARHAHAVPVEDHLLQLDTGASLAAGISGVWAEQKVQSPLVGSFNVSNLVVAMELARAVGLDPRLIARGASALIGVPGRMERVTPTHSAITVLVDYAHKPDALEKALAAVRAQAPYLTVVFGCGGDRDRRKRPMMGKIAVAGADRVFVTSDNPRSENPQAIIEEILAGIPADLYQSNGAAQRVWVQVDRAQAIAEAIRTARAGEWILIAGKGHETYQILGQTQTHFDDREVARLDLARFWSLT